MTEFEYTLKQPFDYAHKGEQYTASMLLCKCPTSKQIDKCARLKQAFYRAAAESAESAQDRQQSDRATRDSDISAQEVLDAICQSNVDFSEVMSIGISLISSGIVLIDGQEKLTRGLIDKMSLDDIESVLGEYYVNFIIASALQNLKSS